MLIQVAEGLEARLDYQAATSEQRLGAWNSTRQARRKCDREAVAILKAMIDAGDELPNDSYARIMLPIARGVVCWEAFDKLAGTPCYPYICKLTVARQKAYALGEKIQVFQPNKPGAEHLLMSPVEIGLKETLQMVFGPAGVRTVAEQAHYISELQIQSVVVNHERVRPQVKINKSLGLLEVKTSGVLTLDELRNIVAKFG